MPDSFVLAGGRLASAATWRSGAGHMLGSISWDDVGLLSRILFGHTYDFDDIEWEAPLGDTQLGRVPDPFIASLARLSDEGLTSLADEWHAALCAEAGWQRQRAHTLLQDLSGLRREARAAIESGGALWLRIEL